MNKGQLRDVAYSLAIYTTLFRIPDSDKSKADYVEIQRGIEEGIRGIKSKLDLMALAPHLRTAFQEVNIISVDRMIRQMKARKSLEAETES